MTVIKSGLNGNVATVTNQNQLNTSAEVKEHDHVKNELDGSVWSLPFENVDPTGTNDNFIYIQNTGAKNIEITDIRISSTVAGQVKINKVSGTAVGGTDISPLSRNTSKTVVPVAIVQSGVDITGLTEEGVWFFMQLDIVNRQYHLHTSSRIILGPTGSVALQWEGATGILTGVISISES